MPNLRQKCADAGNRACLLAVFLFAIFGCASASTAQDDSSQMKADFIPRIKITAPEGTLYIRLFGENDGPIEVPLKDKRYSALLISPELTEKGWAVRLGLQEESLAVSPLGRVELAMDQEVKMDDVGFAVPGWTMKLVPGPLSATAIDGCCSCGRIQCCPLPGNCFGCSKCGTCCSGPPGN